MIRRPKNYETLASQPPQYSIRLWPQNMTGTQTWEICKCSLKIPRILFDILFLFQTADLNRTVIERLSEASNAIFWGAQLRYMLRCGRRSGPAHNRRGYPVVGMNRCWVEAIPMTRRWPDCLLAGGVSPRSSGPADPPIGCADIAPDPGSKLESNIESNIDSSRIAIWARDLKSDAPWVRRRSAEMKSRPRDPSQVFPSYEMCGWVVTSAQRGQGVRGRTSDPT